MNALAPLPPMPTLGRTIIGIGALFPLLIGNLMAIGVCALLIGLGLRLQGRLAHWTWAGDIVSNAAHAGLVIFFAGLTYFATPLSL